MAEKAHFVEGWLIRKLTDAQRTKDPNWREALKPLGERLLARLETNEKTLQLAKDLLPV